MTYCELSKNPAAYNHELVRLTAFVTRGFEDFHLADPTCATEGFSVWVMYGGKAQSDTAYCCPGESAKARPESLTVEGVQVPLVDDLTFRKFTDLLKKVQDTTVRVTARGRFFSLGRSGRLTGPIPGEEPDTWAAAASSSLSGWDRLRHTQELTWITPPKQVGMRRKAVNSAHSAIRVTFLLPTQMMLPNRRSLSRGGRTMEKRPGRSETRNEWQWSR